MLPGRDKHAKRMWSCQRSKGVIVTKKPTNGKQLACSKQTKCLASGTTRAVSGCIWLWWETRTGVLHLDQTHSPYLFWQRAVAHLVTLFVTVPKRSHPIVQHCKHHEVSYKLRPTTQKHSGQMGPGQCHVDHLQLQVIHLNALNLFWHVDISF